MRAGKALDFMATIGEATGESAAAATKEAAPEQAGKLGLSAQPLTPELAQRYGLAGKSGLVVSDVDAGSPAAEAGLQEGDLILEANRKAVNKVSELQATLAESRKDGSILLLVKRKTATLFVAVPLQ
jgi:serine protease Do